VRTNFLARPGLDVLGVAPAQPATAKNMTAAIAVHLRQPRELANIDTRAALLLINARPQGRRLRGACDGRDGRRVWARRFGESLTPTGRCKIQREARA
jgi:hypothetical protein